MKLLFCKECHGVVSLRSLVVTYCTCAKSSGQYDADGLNAWYAGPCEMIGFSNSEFFRAKLLNEKYTRKAGEPGFRFDAFFIPEEAPSVRRV